MTFSLSSRSAGGGKYEINSYIAILIVTLFGIFMTLVILRVINSEKTVVVQANDTIIYYGYQ